MSSFSLKLLQPPSHLRSFHPIPIMAKLIVFCFRVQMQMQEHGGNEDLHKYVFLGTIRILSQIHETLPKKKNGSCRWPLVRLSFKSNLMTKRHGILIVGATIFVKLHDQNQNFGTLIA